MTVQIRSRAQWGARHDRGDGPAPLPARYLFLHHSVMRGTGDGAMRNLEDIGEGRFGAGVSYTFAVDQLGTVFEGHGIERRGSHTRGLNSTARAICAIGNFEEDDPSSALLESIAQLVAHGYRAGWWPARLTGGHRDAPGASTACPGRRLYARIPDINRRVAAILAGHGPNPEELTMAQIDDIDTRLAAIEGKVDRLIAHAKSETAWDGEDRKTLRRMLDAIEAGEIEDARQHAETIKGLMLHEAADAKRGDQA